MFKILITSKTSKHNHIVKRKLYETEAQFKRYLPKHIKNYGSVYNISAYKLMDYEWQEINIKDY
jgi:hypothetical protein